MQPLNRLKYPLVRDILGFLRATFVVREMLEHAHTHTHTHTHPRARTHARTHACMQARTKAQTRAHSKAPQGQNDAQDCGHAQQTLLHAKDSTHGHQFRTLNPRRCQIDLSSRWPSTDHDFSNVFWGRRKCGCVMKRRTPLDAPKPPKKSKEVKSGK